MRLQFTLGAALLLTTLADCGQSFAMGTDFGRFGALAARQDLCDLVCYARRADGSISQANRVLILKEAKGLLSHEEYVSFKRTLDRISPPPKPSLKPAAKQLAETTQKKPASVTTEKTDSGLVIPASANLPDGMAPPVFLR